MPHEPYQFKFTPRDSVLKLADAMEEALRYNEHRGTWLIDDIQPLINKAQAALDELDFANGNTNNQAVYHHSVTVANYMMMIADNVRGK